VYSIVEHVSGFCSSNGDETTAGKTSGYEASGDESADDKDKTSDDRPTHRSYSNAELIRSW